MYVKEQRSLFLTAILSGTWCWWSGRPRELFLLAFALWSSRAPQVGYCYYLSDWMAEDCLECGRNCGSGVQLGLRQRKFRCFFY